MFRPITHFDRLPSIRYRRPLSVGAHDFPHLLDSRIGRHQVVKGQLILVVNPANVATPGDLPEDQTKSVHVRPLERVEVVHVYRLFKNLKAERAFVQTAEVLPSWPSAGPPRNFPLLSRDTIKRHASNIHRSSYLSLKSLFVSKKDS